MHAQWTVVLVTEQAADCALSLLPASQAQEHFVIHGEPFGFPNRHLSQQLGPSGWCAKRNSLPNRPVASISGPLG